MDYLTREDIRSLSTEQSFERGVTYWKQGRVQELEIDDQKIRATVLGSSEYNVSIGVEHDTIHTHCSCPYDYAGDCKHIVAVLLVVDDRGNEERAIGVLEDGIDTFRSPADLRWPAVDLYRDRNPEKY